LAWVLESCYDQRRTAIADVLEKILSTREFEVEERDLAWNACRDYRDGSADFADCLIGRKNSASGCSRTVTFDQGLKRLAHFQIL
jgi:predicted nucleic-acid-binding protein